jgi:hypothetical protein
VPQFTPRNTNMIQALNITLTGRASATAYTTTANKLYSGEKKLTKCISTSNIIERKVPFSNYDTGSDVQHKLVVLSEVVKKQHEKLTK